MEEFPLQKVFWRLYREGLPLYGDGIKFPALLLAAQADEMVLRCAQEQKKKRMFRSNAEMILNQAKGSETIDLHDLSTYNRP